MKGLKADMRRSNKRGAEFHRRTLDAEAVVKILKRREVYRHLSNSADRVALAGATLHAIVVKWT